MNVNQICTCGHGRHWHKDGDKDGDPPGACYIQPTAHSGPCRCKAFDPVNVKGSDGGPLPADEEDYTASKDAFQSDAEGSVDRLIRQANERVEAAFDRCARFADNGVSVEFARTMSENEGTRACRTVAETIRNHAKQQKRKGWPGP